MFVKDHDERTLPLPSSGGAICIEPKHASDYPTCLPYRAGERQRGASPFSTNMTLLWSYNCTMNYLNVLLSKINFVLLNLQQSFDKPFAF